MGIISWLFGSGKSQSHSSPQEINAAPRVGGLDQSDTCDIRTCQNCGFDVWVNKRLPSGSSVYCIECASELARRSGNTPEWRFPFEKEKLCTTALKLLAQGVTADQIANHVDACPVCKAAIDSRKGNRQPVHEPVNPDEVPTMLVVGIDGRFVLNDVVSLARKNAKDLIVMGNRSPAFKDANVLLRESPKFHHDPKLVLVFEKYVPPLSGDPLVIVRRSFLLDAGGQLKADTLGEFAILLTMEATKRSLKVSFV